jgi:hypothetical protein
MKLSKPIDEMTLQQLRLTAHSLAQWIAIENNTAKRGALNIQLAQVTEAIKRRKRR